MRQRPPRPTRTDTLFTYTTLFTSLITDPRIRDFDGATSALDYESEHAVMRNMRAICQNRTVLIIAHRLSTVRMANRIIVVDKGRIVESGHHDQLVDRPNGHYARLFKLQQGLASDPSRPPSRSSPGAPATPPTPPGRSAIPPTPP